jgi:negative regulator of sigma E activity
MRADVADREGNCMEKYDITRRATKENAERIAAVLENMAQGVRENYDKIDYLESQNPDGDTYVEMLMLADL